MKPEYIFVAHKVFHIQKEHHSYDPLSWLAGRIESFCCCRDDMFACSLPMTLLSVADEVRSTVLKAAARVVEDRRFQNLNCRVTALREDEEQMMLLAKGYQVVLPEVEEHEIN